MEIYNVTTLPRRLRRIWPKISELIQCGINEATVMLDSTLALFLPVLLLLVHQVLAQAGAGAVTHLPGVGPVGH